MVRFLASVIGDVRGAVVGTALAVVATAGIGFGMLTGGAAAVGGAAVATVAGAPVATGVAAATVASVFVPSLVMAATEPEVTAPTLGDISVFPLFNITGLATVILGFLAAAFVAVATVSLTLGMGWRVFGWVRGA